MKSSFQIRSSKKMDFVRHRGRSSLSPRNIDKIDEVVDKSLRSSKSVEYNRSLIYSKPTCQICNEISFKSSRSLSESEAYNSTTKRKSIQLKHESLNVTYVKKKKVISAKKVTLLLSITPISLRY